MPMNSADVPKTFRVRMYPASVSLPTKNPGRKIRNVCIDPIHAIADGEYAERGPET